MNSLYKLLILPRSVKEEKTNASIRLSNEEFKYLSRFIKNNDSALSD